MQKVLFSFLSLAIVLGVLTSQPAFAGKQPEKEWTFAVFMNGHNNLDRFTDLNLNQMEKIGSTKDLNIVVQWASLRSQSVRRVYVQKDNNPNQVTSPVVESMGQVDMGDWKNVVEFVKWAHTNYPAKKFFLAIWDHGSGWHAMKMYGSSAIHINDISWDDHTGNSITTEQMSLMMSESAKVLGHKVDLYASDACLMAMAELASEVKDSVSVYAGSEETEPGTGWPYDDFLKKWVTKAQATPQEVASMLTDAYADAYSGGQYGSTDVTFSSYDLNQVGAFEKAISDFRARLLAVPVQDKPKLSDALQKSTEFAYSDYRDLGHFLGNVKKSNAVVGTFADAVADLEKALKGFVNSNRVSGQYADATGVSIWLPASGSTFNQFKNRYQSLTFDRETHWSDFLAEMAQ